MKKIKIHLSLFQWSPPVVSFSALAPCCSCGSSPRSLEADTPQHKPVGCADLQTSFIFDIYYFLVLLELSFLPSAIYICAFLLFLLSLNMFSICFQWLMLLLPIVRFPFSSSTSEFSAHAQLYVCCTSHFLIFPSLLQTRTILLVRDMSQKVWFLPWSLLALHSGLMIFHLPLLLFYWLCFLCSCRICVAFFKRTSSRNFQFM